MKKLFVVFALLAFAVPAVAQEEGSGEYAASIAAGAPIDVPPGIYANTAERLAAFFGATGGARTIFASDLLGRIANNTNQLIVDVRPATDYAAGHIPGAISIPLTVLFRSENLALLPTDGTPIVLVCHTGHTASMGLGGLVALGYNAYVLRFGMMGWNATSNQKISTSTVSQPIYGLGGPTVR